MVEQFHLIIIKNLGREGRGGEERGERGERRGRERERVHHYPLPEYPIHVLYVSEDSLHVRAPAVPPFLSYSK
jgi:hypothetical protein